MIITACSATLRTPKRDNLQRLSNSNRQILDGTYKNKAVQDSIFLGGLLNYFPSDSIWRIENVTIKIESINRKRIKLEAFVGDTLKASRYLKGKFRQGYFRLKTKNTGFCIPFVYCFRDSYKAQIGMANEMLIVDFAESWFGNIFIINAGDNGQRSFTFVKK